MWGIRKKKERDNLKRQAIYLSTAKNEEPRWKKKSGPSKKDRRGIMPSGERSRRERGNIRSFITQRERGGGGT